MSGVRTWIRTADSPVARSIRSLRRASVRRSERARHGSVSAAMDAVVREATAGTVGSALSPELRVRARLARARRRDAR
ncbi:MAG: hypothetical protein ACOYOP_01940 [Microthrixaceae bacterium]